MSSLIQFILPCAICVNGYSSSGKTVFVQTLLKQRDRMFNVKISKILYCYGIWNESFGEMESDSDISFMEGLPNESQVKELPAMSIIVFDDLMDQVSNNKYIESLFSRGSHHLNLCLIYISQNLFYQGVAARSITLNQHYIVLMRNSRDVRQIQYLARQIGMGKKLLEVYEHVMLQPFAHLLVNLSPYSTIDCKLFTDIFNENVITGFQ